MRSIKNIKERVTDFGNLRDAYFHARRSKRFRNEVLEPIQNLRAHRLGGSFSALLR